MVDEMGLDLGDLASPAVRHILEPATSAPPGSGLPLHALDAADRRLAASLTIRDLPELAPPPTRSPSSGPWPTASAGPAHRRRRRARRDIGALLAASGDLDPERDENVAARLRRLLEEDGSRRSDRRPTGRPATARSSGGG